MRQPARLVVPLLFLLTSAGAAGGAADPEQERAAQSAAARKILEAYRAAEPAQAERVIHLVYWTPADREPQPGYEQRLSRTLRHIQQFFAREMDHNGFGPITFRLDTSGDDKPLRIHLVRGARPYADYSGDSGRAIRTECLPVLKQAGIDADAETVVIFCNMSNWDAGKRTMSQNSPYYASGTNRGGTAWQVDSALLDSELLTTREPILRDGQYGKISVGRYNSIFVGGVAHELGHALGLPHCRERADQRERWGTALMGSGNRTYGEDLRGEGRGSFLTFAEAARLASHPSLCGSVRGLERPANGALRDVAIETDGKSFRFTARVTADPPAYVVVGYLDPAGGGDYDATTATAVPDADGRFTLRCDALASGKPGVLRVVVGQANGAMSSFASATDQSNFPYSVAKDGTIDLTASIGRLKLARLSAAVRAGDAKAARQSVDALRGGGGGADTATLDVAEALAGSLEAPGPSPADSPGERCTLSRAKPASATVGYYRPTYDRLPGDGDPLLVVGGRLFARGVYAHAPAAHAWDLGGKWSKLTGAAGVADGHGGSVRFVVVGDGKELWSSATVQEGTIVSLDVPVEGVQKLELRTEDAGDGNRQDWGLWLEPTLVR